jgi:hypothetical protein
MKALTLSTNIALGEEEELSTKEIAGTMLFALVLGFGLFLVAPVFATKGLGALAGTGIENPVLFNLIEGAIRIGIFILYIVGITWISKDIKRFFAYHGAEHKAIKVYERGEELVPRTRTSSTRATSAAGRASSCTCWSSHPGVLAAGCRGMAVHAGEPGGRHPARGGHRLRVHHVERAQREEPAGKDTRLARPADAAADDAGALGRHGRGGDGVLKKVLSMEEQAKIEPNEATNKLVI